MKSRFRRLRQAWKPSTMVVIAVFLGFVAGWWAHPTAISAAPSTSPYGAFAGTMVPRFPPLSSSAEEGKERPQLESGATIRWDRVLRPDAGRQC